MKAAQIQFHGGPLEIKEIDIPVPKNDEVLIKIHASGCCHTDVHAMDGDWPVKSKLPLTPGHEGAGEVVEVGADVKNVKIGDRVGIPWLHSACGACEFCNTGWETLCLKQQNTGYSVDGGLGEYAIGRASHVIPIPDKVGYVESAPILCAGITAYKALKETEAKPGQVVTIIGAAGGLGHLAVQYAKAMGLIVIAVDVGQDKLEFTKKLGADFAVDALDPKLIETVNGYSHGGSHGVLVFATNPKAFKASVDLSRRKGTIVCVGLPAGTFDTSIFDVVLKRLTIRGSIVGTREDANEAFQFVDRGLVKCAIETAKFENVANVFERLRAGKINGRVVIDFSS
eukprot:CAMPEP_0196761158 /NCGR_PEP_ID=MMETSP1095-20130614/303_1 /TAXON_ID=96789 ORGANISM="Chromulina nebulosa, Strain UTEXLB2642" /NCGR_SAMPLE_ID=MMETSP1095 /ASSEMBLY_ACC=CAM_ASM_000446 /LENGTH=340 /DNA_ID=CAMNT_0042110337 /DNA_START=172 /DNA_END=1194 /DNA_ORIENTATION=-